MQRVQVQSLVRELGSRVPRGMAKTEKRRAGKEAAVLEQEVREGSAPNFTGRAVPKPPFFCLTEAEVPKCRNFTILK